MIKAKNLSIIFTMVVALSFIISCEENKPKSGLEDGAIQLTSGGLFSCNFYPVWSPVETSVTRIAHLMNISSYAILIMNDDGSNHYQFSNWYCGIDGISWNPDAQENKIALGLAINEGDECQIFIGEITIPFEPVQLTTDGGFDPSLSPDGSTIAYVNEDVNGLYQIWTIPVTGGEPSQLSHADFATSPCWSPDGTKIAFTNYYYDGNNGHNSIWIIPSGGGQATYLVDGEDPTWSPDGQWIAYSGASTPPNTNLLNIFKIPVTGGTPVQITSEPDVGMELWGAQHPSWSPDGEWIAFDSDRQIDGEGIGMQIYKIRAN